MRSLVGLPAEGAQVTSTAATFRMDVANVFDPSKMIVTNFELRGAGFDGAFNTSDDRLVPLTLTFSGTGSTAYMIGTNRLNFAVGVALFPDRYRFSALPALTDPFGTPLDGNGDGIGGDALTRTFTLLPVTNPHVINLADGQMVTTAGFGNHDIAPPRAMGAQFHFATSHAISIAFSEDLSGWFTLDDLELLNATTGRPVDTSGFTAAWNPFTNTGMFIVNSILPDGDYIATIRADGLRDRSGNPLDGNGDGVGGDDLVFDFWFLQGDVNRDRRITLQDFNIVANNFGLTNAGFMDGDLNYDGLVDLTDFDILATSFGNALPGEAHSIFDSESHDRDRIIDDLLA
jgi:hypothetical protein